MTRTSNKTMATWYVCYADGAGWTAIAIDDLNEVCDTVEQANADTHIQAGDRWARIAEAIRDENTAAIGIDVAESVIAALGAYWDADLDPECVVVERIESEVIA